MTRVIPTKKERPTVLDEVLKAQPKGEIEGDFVRFDATFGRSPALDSCMIKIEISSRLYLCCVLRLSSDVMLRCRRVPLPSLSPSLSVY